LIEQVLGRLSKAIGALGDERRKHVDDWRRAAIELAVAVAGVLTKRQLEMGYMPVVEFADELIAACDPGLEVRVFLHPQDIRVLQGRLSGKPLFEGLGNRVQLVPDPDLSRGDCRVEDGQQVLVSRLGERLSEVREELIRGLGHVSN
jgi:flagellar assembly protein FliH